MVSRTPYGCVDWNILWVIHKINNIRVAPHMGAWIETSPIAQSAQYRASHPIWVRGLKHKSEDYLVKRTECRTPYGCVDWNISNTMFIILLKSRTPYGCVDWNLWYAVKWCCPLSRTPYGCVDWNNMYQFIILLLLSRTPYGCVDWNSEPLYDLNGQKCRTPYGCVDWNWMICV